MRADFVHALAEGRAAEIGAANPYAGQSLALAKMWRRGYKTMLLRRRYETPTMQAYARARPAKRR